MASTNSTTHYELSQYIGTDKPTYLVDYNQDMSKIDAGIYGAKSEADTNTTSIGTLSSLQTTEKSNLVGAVNEVNTNSTNNATSIGTLSNLTTTEKSNLVGAINELKSEADGNKTNIGTLANLETTEKSNLVGAVNEVDGNIGSLSSLSTNTKTNVVSAINEIFDYLNLSDIHALTNPVVQNTSGQTMTGATVESNKIKVALNEFGTYGKIYGSIRISGITGYPRVKFINTGIKGVTETFEFEGGLIYGSNVAGVIVQIDPPAQNETSASVTLRFGAYTSTTTANLFPCIYYFKDFGDSE